MLDWMWYVEGKWVLFNNNKIYGKSNVGWRDADKVGNIVKELQMS